jgi:hypothetical protein
VLKQWIDIISQPGWTFGFDDNGYVPLLTDKKAAIVYTSGTFASDRGPSLGRDFQSTYFEDWLNLIGVTHITETRLQPTILSPSFKEQRAGSALGASAGRIVHMMRASAKPHPGCTSSGALGAERLDVGDNSVQNDGQRRTVRLRLGRHKAAFKGLLANVTCASAQRCSAAMESNGPKLS